MKISRWYDIDWFTFFMVLFVVLAVGGVGTAIGISIYKQQKLQNTFPVGSPIQLKGLNIKGNVVSFNDSQVTILVIDSAGESHKLTTDTTLLSK